MNKLEKAQYCPSCNKPWHIVADADISGSATVAMTLTDGNLESDYIIDDDIDIDDTFHYRCGHCQKPVPFKDKETFETWVSTLGDDPDPNQLTLPI